MTLMKSELPILMNAKTIDKVFQVTPISEKIEAYHSDEMRELWVSGSRNWDIYSKKIMEVSF